MWVWMVLAVALGFIVGYVGNDIYNAFFNKDLYEPPKELEYDDDD